MNSQISNKQDTNYDYVSKVVLVGDSSVGKSNLLSRYIHNSFSEDKKPTLGVEFGTRIINSREKNIKVQIWDTAGQEKYKSITNSYYINSKGVMLIFDLTRKSSFENIDKWINEVYDITGKDICIILVGNKSDLNLLREVTSEDGINKAEKYKIQYIETSALSGENVDKVFQKLTDLIYDNFLYKINLENEEKITSKLHIERLTTDKSLCKC